METEYELDEDTETELQDWTDQWVGMGDDEIAVEMEMLDSDLALATAGTLHGYGVTSGDSDE